MAFSTEELQHKMSKKIAQLTKVIYNLNTRNEDAQMELEWTVTRHKTAMQEVTQDARRQVQHLQNELERKEKALKSMDTLKTLKMRHEKEKSEVLAAIEQFKNNERKKRETLQGSLDHQVENMTAQVKVLQEKFDKKLKVYEAQKHSSSSTMEETKVKHADEMSDLVLRTNFKYNEMLTEQLNVQDSIRITLINEKKDALASQQQEHAQHLKNVQATLRGEKERAVGEKTADAERKAEAIKKDLIGKMERLLVDLEALRREEKKLRQDKQVCAGFIISIFY